jgi:glutathione synthase
MRVGLMVNDVLTEQAGYTTVRLAMQLLKSGHEAWLMGSGDFIYDTDEKVHAIARTGKKASYSSEAAFLKEIQGPKAKIENVTVDDIDVLLLRSDPSTEHGDRAWAQGAGIVFGRVAMRHGVIVLNDPNGLAKATNKMYFQLFPAEVRPRTLISRNRDEIKAFIKEEGGQAVLKPLQGSGGAGVFLVQKGSGSNVNQMIEALTRDGYVIAQEYLAAASEGDTRLFVMNGRPFRYRGKYAAFRRVRSGDDMRSNIHAGGKLREAEITDVHLKVAEIVRPKLVQDGMFLVGLDLVGDKLMEINVFSPGGLGSAQRFEKVRFTQGVVDALERKVNYVSYYQRRFDNVDIATL